MRPDPAFAAAVRRLRTERGITQETLAFNANLAVSTLACVERGKSDPLFTTLVKLADALEVGLDGLVRAAEDGEA